MKAFLGVHPVFMSRGLSWFFGKICVGDMSISHRDSIGVLTLIFFWVTNYNKPKINAWMVSAVSGARFCPLLIPNFFNPLWAMLALRFSATGCLSKVFPSGHSVDRPLVKCFRNKRLFLAQILLKKMPRLLWSWFWYSTSHLFNIFDLFTFRLFVEYQTT